MIKEVSEISKNVSAKEISSKTKAFENANKDVKQPPRHIATINENLKGQTVPGTNVEYKSHTFKANGELVEGVFPKFQPVAEVRIPPMFYKASDTTQFELCTKSLQARIERDPSLASKFTPRQLEQIKNGNPRISGLTWHHNEVPGKMQLVDADVHARCRHTGGRSIWGGGGECR
ncbi:HNH endonuclease [Butyrivibrio sp. INlla16]|uniref:HNH endonuclease n=1 Tax=Butyrivibrio sp. INlla16 TaxID=1520807 RepID=UPI00087F0F0B|nr:HNH endonuclease [Butyrivibrio sp. INlla16]SDB13803.1 DNase/tRNase domain of colicin-like bacteriocin [Butyrivibrio sp. INlla16]